MNKVQRLLDEIHHDINNTSRYFHDVPCDGDDYIRPFKVVRLDNSSPVSPEAKLFELLDNFKHIPAAPRLGGLHRLAYIYPRKVRKGLKLTGNLLRPLDGTEVPPPIAVNDRDLGLEKVAQELARYALASRSWLRDAEAIVVSGQRGVGKTAFLNSLFSTQHATFDAKKVIWVRVDLTLLESLDRGIMELLDYQTHYILRTRYLNGGSTPHKRDFFDDIDYEFAVDAWNQRKQDLSLDSLRNYLYARRQELSGIGVNKVLVQIENVDRLLSLDDKELLDTDETVRTDVVDRIDLYRKFVAKQGYSFIYVLDGLDEVTIPIQDSQALERWKRDVEAILQGRRVPRGLYIVCARHESFRKIFAHIDHSAIPRSLRKWVVEPADFHELISNRLRMFSERTNRADKDAGIKGWQLKEADLYAELTLFSIRHAFSKVGIQDDIFVTFSTSGHARSLLGFFRDAMWETWAILMEAGYDMTEKVPKLAMRLLDNPAELEGMKERLRKKHYRIWSLSSLNYSNYFETSIRYNHPIDRIEFPRRSKGLPLIPTVWGDVPLPRSPGRFNNHLLLKIRILQILDNAKGEDRTFAEVRDTVSSIFQYEPKNVEIILKIMMVQRLVDIVAAQDFLISLDATKLEITDLGLRVIRDWIYLPEYVEYTLQLAALPASVRNDFKRFLVRRERGPLAGYYEEVSMKTGRYVARLIPTWAKFLAVMAAIERWEQTRVNLRRTSSAKRAWLSQYELGPVTDVLRANIIQKIHTMLESWGDDILDPLCEYYEIGQQDQ